LESEISDIKGMLN